MKWKRLIKPALFIVGGAVVGFAYYLSVGCSSGTCAITGNPVSAMLYMAAVGWLLSNAFPDREKAE